MVTIDTITRVKEQYYVGITIQEKSAILALGTVKEILTMLDVDVNYTITLGSCQFSCLPVTLDKLQALHKMTLQN